MKPMRTLKFRAWHPDKKVMITNGLIIQDGKCYLSRGDFEDSIQTNNAMQFTGLLDKAGKEIYEGDIIKADGRDSAPAAVEWNDKLLQWEARITLAFFHEPIVIGNIYENPDLLKATLTPQD